MSNHHSAGLGAWQSNFKLKNLDGIVFEPVEDTLQKVKLCFRQDWIPQSSSATSKYYVKENMREDLTASVENQMVQPKQDINSLSLMNFVL